MIYYSQHNTTIATVFYYIELSIYIYCISLYDIIYISNDQCVIISLYLCVTLELDIYIVFVYEIQKGIQIICLI